jgi:hypothetical protein
MPTVSAVIHLSPHFAGLVNAEPRSGGWSHFGEETVERACDLSDRLDADAGIERCGVELLVAEQHLDEANVCLLFK